MDSKAVIGIVTVIVIAAAAAYVVLSDDDGAAKSTDYSGADASDIRLRIYGNANGDDVIDATDVAILERIIDEGISGWRSEYHYADADQDGRITGADVDVVNRFISKEKERMYYDNRFDRITYVNYPMGRIVGAESSQFELLEAIHMYDCLKGVDQGIKSGYTDATYPGISGMSVIGTTGSYTVDSLSECGMETVLLWTGGMARDYFWDAAEASGLSDRISLPILRIQGREVINSALMLACMFGDQSLSDDYCRWYDRAMAEVVDKLNSGAVQKKTVTCVPGFVTSQDQLRAYGGQLSPALWFNEVLDFQPQYKDIAGFIPLGYEGFVREATDEVVVMIIMPSEVTPGGFNDYLEETFANLFINTKQYENQTLYPIEWDAMQSIGGPAGCYILASFLYPDRFDRNGALDFLQEFLDEFWILPGADARQGFTYTGDGYGPNAERVKERKERNGEMNPNCTIEGSRAYNPFKKVAFYGKGGIGKSTTVSNTSAALADMGYKVMQIGCDPKSDSTVNLTKGVQTPTVLNTMVEKNNDVDLEDLVFEGAKGILCIETGGPKPGCGCAGRGILTAFEQLERLEAFDEYKPDIILYDVLGDVVCGGFALPIRNGYADEVCIVTSGEKMALYAARNINQSVANNCNHGYAKVKGLVLNSRNTPNERETVEKAAAEMGTKVLIQIPRDSTVQAAEDAGQTVVEYAPESPMAEVYRNLGRIVAGDGA